MEGLLSFQPYSLAACLRQLVYTNNERKKTHVLDKHETLGVGDDLGSVQSLFKVVNESLLVTFKLGSGATENVAGTDTLVLDGREATREDSFTDEGDRHAEVEGVDGSPLSGTLLTGLVEDLLNEGCAVLVVVLEDITGDLNQEGVEDTLVPLVENFTDLVGGKTNTALEDIVGLSQPLE